MKYESPANNSYGSTFYSSSENSNSEGSNSESSSYMPIIPKGLTPIIYDAIEYLSHTSYYPIYWGDNALTRENIYKISKELSDNNIGRITFEKGNTMHPICIEKNKSSWDMKTQFRVIIYRNTEELTTTFIKDIQEMAKEEYLLSQFQNSYNEDRSEYLYSAKFTKQSNYDS